MAVILRAAVSTSTFGRLASGLARSSSSGAAARVIRGTDHHPSRLLKSKVSFQNIKQQSSFVKSKSASTLTAGFGDLGARCGAATVAVCPLPTSSQGVGVLDRPIMEVDQTSTTRPAPVKMRPPSTIDQSAVPLPRSFLAESVSGSLVECSGRGSRPLYTNVLAEFQLSYTAMITSPTTDQAPLHDHITDMKRAAFQTALETAPGDARLLREYATFMWKSLDDVNAAEELYTKALELAPHDSAIQASHALFLWQCED